jgi:hypothetical protein
MKKLFGIIFANLLSGFIIAQDDVDAMRYSQTSFYGDSRFMAMGGSFGALGANISCMNFNPAGIAMYRNGEFVVTPGVRVQNANAVHYDSSSTDFSTKLNISNIGFVTAWDQRNPYPSQSKLYPKWNERNAFGISYNRLADYNFNTTINGNTSNSSIINDFVNLAQGHYPSNLTPTYEGLAYQTYLINPQSSSDSSHYWGMMLPNTPLQQQKTMKQTGRMGELAFSFAHSFDDKFYLGATLGIPMIKYNRQSTYTELDYKNDIKPFRSLKYEEQLLTTGTGYNLKVGVIYRATEQIRVGAYVHSPSIINLSDNYEYKMTATYDTAITSSGNAYSSDYIGYYKYKLYTPARAGASAAYVYNKLLAVNADVEFVGYGSAKYKDPAGALNNINFTIQKKYTSAVNVRIGGELNTGSLLLRAGYAGYSSPFGSFTGKFARSSYSAGVGFKRKSNTYFDLGIIYTMWSEDYYLYDPALVQATNIRNSVLYFTFTLGVKFN